MGPPPADAHHDPQHLETRHLQAQRAVEARTALLDHREVEPRDVRYRLHPARRMQAIANIAGFHFAMIEQGGSSLYSSLSLKVSSLEVLRIVVSIGGGGTHHFLPPHHQIRQAVLASPS